MAVDLSAEIKKLNGDDSGDSGDSGDDASEKPEDTSTDETDAEPTPTLEAPAAHEGPAVQTFADYSAASAAPPSSPAKYPTIAEDQTGAPIERSITYPTIAEDQRGPAVQTFSDYAAQPEPATVPAGHIDLGPPGRNIYTDPDTGSRYVVDPDTGQMVPHAELATPADKAPPPSGGVQLPQIDVTGTAPAPDRLTQVERAQLVKLPTAAPAPDTLTQVERGQLVNVPRGTQPAPGTLSQVEKGIALPPKVQAAQPVTAAPQPVVQPPQPVAGGIQTFADYSGGTYKPQQPVAAQPPAQQPAGGVPAEPKIDIQAQSYTQGRTQEPSKLILHSTDGSSEKADINTLTGSDPGHRVSVNYYVTKDGRVMHFVSEGDTAWHAGADRYGGNGNAYTLGIEQQHVDGKEPWPDAQVRATAGVAAGILARHPNMTIDDIIGHSDLAGERKQDPVDYPWAKFRQYVAEAQQGTSTVSEREPQPATVGQPAVPSAEPATKLKTGFYQDEKPGDFLNGRVTTFATPDDIASGQDNGVGAPKLGRLDTTQVAGVAIPQEALQQMFGRDWAAAARAARVDVVDPASGKRLRVPIVDLGPNTDAVSDMTPALAKYFGGDKNLAIKIVPNAGPDVMKNPQLFNDEQAAIKSGFDSSTVGRAVQKIGVSGLPIRAQTPEEAAAAQQSAQAAIAKQQDIVSKLPEVQSGNVIQAYQRLDQGVDGVSPAYIKNAQANLKQEAIAQVRQKYPEIKTDEDAWKVAQTPAWMSTAPITELGTAVYAGYTKADLAFNQMMQGADTNRLTDFAKALHPDYKPEGLTAFVKSITDIKDPTQRSQMIGHLMANLPEATQSMFDSVALSDSADRIGSPAYQKAQSDALTTKRAYLDHLESPDPRLKGSWIEKGAQLIGSVPAMASMAVVPGGTSLFAAQIYSDTKAKLQADHPDWSDSQINDTTQKSTIAQLAPQGILAAVSAGQLGRVGELIEQWTGGKVSFGGAARAMEGVENPALRAVVGAAPHIVTGAGAGAAQQVAANIAEGRPVGEGVPGAAVGGAVMGAPAGIAHGIGAAIERPPERAAVVEPPVQPSTAEQPPQPVTAAEVTGPEVAPSGPVTQEDVARRAYELFDERTRNGQPGTALDDWTQAQKELSQAKEPILPATVSEAEPITSAIANRYVQERMAAGELGQIDPSQGKSTEDMVQQGLEMSRTQRDGLIDNFMKAKGGDLDEQGAAIRSAEALLSEQARAASRTASADPTNPQLQAQAKAAADAVTAFHNGPIKKFKQVWSDSGRALQREIPLDYTTFNGMKEAYLKGNNQEAPLSLEPKLKRMAEVVSKTADTERVAMNNLGQEIENQTRGKIVPDDDQIRTRLMEIQKDLPCPS